MPMTTNLVDDRGITRFLEQLGRCYRHAGSIYLVGGSSLILVAAKESTFDIDLKIDIAPEHHSEFIRCLRQVSRELQFQNVMIQARSDFQLHYNRFRKQQICPGTNLLFSESVVVV